MAVKSDFDLKLSLLHKALLKSYWTRALMNTSENLRTGSRLGLRWNLKQVNVGFKRYQPVDRRHV
jgi:hypothetical protein